MSVTHVHQIFFPSSVVVFGVDSDPGRTILTNILAGDYSGQVYPISAAAREISGRVTYPAVKSIEAAIDLAVLPIPIETLPAAISACGQAGVRGVVIPTRGPCLPGLNDVILSEARRWNIRLIGPRSWGVINPWAGLNASSGSQLPQRGQLAVLSQSAAICAGILDLSLSKQIGLSLLVGLGDMLDIDCADLLDYVTTHFSVGAILLHVEQVANMRRFMSAARAAAQIKPVVVLKTGRSQLNDGEAITTTGKLIRSDAVYAAAFKRAGIIRADTVADLFDCGDLVSKQCRPRGVSLAILSNARSPAIMAVDFLNVHGLQPAVLSSETVGALGRILSCQEPHHPITIPDVLAPEAYREVIGICLAAPEINGILVIIASPFLSNSSAVARMIASAVSVKSIPVFAVWMGGKALDAGRRILDGAGIPTYDTPERAVRAFLYLHDYDRNLKLLQQIPRRLPSRFAVHQSVAREIIDRAFQQTTPLLTPLESLELLQAYEVPTVPAETARSPEEALRLAAKCGYPVTLTPLCRDITNATQAQKGLQALHTPAQVEAEFEHFLQRAADAYPATKSFTAMVQPFISGPNLEIRLGSRIVAPFGPVMLFGRGGTPADICADYTIGLPPLNRLLARRMLETTRTYMLLKGRGGLQPDSRPAVEELLVRFAHLLVDFPEISEMEIHPVVVVDGRALAACAWTIIRLADSPAPLHLILSAYPDEYETETVTKAGVPIFIRPIKPEDASLLQELWATLSPRTLYYRFSQPFTKLTPDLLVRFTQIDYDREIALIALQTTGSRDRMLGVARLIYQPGTDIAEFAIVVGDPWQGLGVGAKLLGCLAAIALRRQIKTLWGLVLKENRAIIGLCRGLGWTVEADEDPSQVFLKLDVSSIDSPEIREAFGTNRQAV